MTFRREPPPRQILFSPDYFFPLCLSHRRVQYHIMEHNKDSTAVSPVVDAPETAHAVSSANNTTITTLPAGESVREITSEAQPPSYEEYVPQLDLDDIR